MSALADLYEDDDALGTDEEAQAAREQAVIASGVAVGEPPMSGQPLPRPPIASADEPNAAPEDQAVNRVAQGPVGRFAGAAVDAIPQTADNVGTVIASMVGAGPALKAAEKGGSAAIAGLLAAGRAGKNPLDFLRQNPNAGPLVGMGAEAAVGAGNAPEGGPFGQAVVGAAARTPLLLSEIEKKAAQNVAPRLGALADVRSGIEALAGETQPGMAEFVKRGLGDVAKEVEARTPAAAALDGPIGRGLTRKAAKAVGKAPNAIEDLLGAKQGDSEAGKAVNPLPAIRKALTDAADKAQFTYMPGLRDLPSSHEGMNMAATHAMSVTKANALRESALEGTRAMTKDMTPAEKLAMDSYITGKDLLNRMEVSGQNVAEGRTKQEVLDMISKGELYFMNDPRKLVQNEKVLRDYNAETLDILKQAGYDVKGREDYMKHVVQKHRLGGPGGGGKSGGVTVNKPGSAIRSVGSEASIEEFPYRVAAVGREEAWRALESKKFKDEMLKHSLNEDIRAGNLEFDPTKHSLYSFEGKGELMSDAKAAEFMKRSASGHVGGEFESQIKVKGGGTRPDGTKIMGEQRMGVTGGTPKANDEIDTAIRTVFPRDPFLRPNNVGPNSIRDLSTASRFHAFSKEAGLSLKGFGEMTNYPNVMKVIDWGAAAARNMRLLASPAFQIHQWPQDIINGLYHAPVGQKINYLKDVAKNVKSIGKGYYDILKDGSSDLITGLRKRGLISEIPENLFEQEANAATGSIITEFAEARQHRTPAGGALEWVKSGLRKYRDVVTAIGNTREATVKDALAKAMERGIGADAETAAFEAAKRTGKYLMSSPSGRVMSKLFPMMKWKVETALNLTLDIAKNIKTGKSDWKGLLKGPALAIVAEETLRHALQQINPKDSARMTQRGGFAGPAFKADPENDEENNRFTAWVMDTPTQVLHTIWGYLARGPVDGLEDAAKDLMQHENIVPALIQEAAGDFLKTTTGQSIDPAETEHMTHEQKRAYNAKKGGLHFPFTNVGLEPTGQRYAEMIGGGPVSVIKTLTETDSGNKGMNVARSYLPTPILPYAARTDDSLAKARGQGGRELEDAWIEAKDKAAKAYEADYEAAGAKADEEADEIKDRLLKMGKDMGALRRARTEGRRNSREAKELDANQRKDKRRKHMKPDDEEDDE